MKIAVIDVFNPLPINSGGDWYRYQVLQDLAQENDVTEYYLVHDKFDKGYIPEKVPFRTELLRGRFRMPIRSQVLDVLRPDLYISKKKLRQIKADIIIYSAYCYPFAKIITKANNNAKMLLLMHNVEWQYLKNNHFKPYWLFKQYEDLIIKEADGIITLSEHDREYVRSVRKKGQVHYLPPLVNERIFNPSGKKHCMGDDKVNVLFYGSLDRKQNIEAIDYIIDEILPEMEKDKGLRLCIFGSGKPPQKLLDNLDRVSFLGSVEDPAEFVRGADVVIVPVKNSGGVKIRILEAMACQVPVIVSPESAEGLPMGLLDHVRVAATPSEYLSGIKESISDRTMVLNPLKFREIVGNVSASTIINDYRFVNEKPVVVQAVDAPELREELVMK